jgi:hypothetical protein
MSPFSKYWWISLCVYLWCGPHHDDVRRCLWYNSHIFQPTVVRGRGDQMYSRSWRARFTRFSTANFLLQTACLKKLTYLDQVMNETLGLWLPAPITVRVANEVCPKIRYVIKARADSKQDTTHRRGALASWRLSNLYSQRFRNSIII